MRNAKTNQKLKNEFNEKHTNMYFVDFFVFYPMDSKDKLQKYVIAKKH